MKRSTASKILTTHVGSLPRNDGTDRPGGEDAATLRQSGADVVARQREILGLPCLPWRSLFVAIAQEAVKQALFATYALIGIVVRVQPSSSGPDRTQQRPNSKNNC